MKPEERLKRIRVKIETLQLAFRALRAEIETKSGKKQRPPEGSRIRCFRRNGDLIGVGIFRNKTNEKEGWRGAHVEYEGNLSGRYSTWWLVNRWELA